jgi:hypothetical protein
VDKPRCKTCIHWNKEPLSGAAVGICEAEPPHSREPSGGLWKPPLTAHNQGCALHQDFAKWFCMRTMSEVEAADLYDALYRPDPGTVKALHALFYRDRKADERKTDE